MRNPHTVCWSRWRHLAVLSAVFGWAILLAATALWAGSTKKDLARLPEGRFVPVDTTLRDPRPAAMAAFKRLERDSGRRWYIEWYNGWGLPKLMKGMTQKRYPGTPGEAALAFIEEYKQLWLGIEDQERLAQHTMRVFRTHEHREYTAVSIKQYYKGIEVGLGNVGVEILPDGRIREVQNTFKPVELEDIEPRLNPAEANEIIVHQAGADSLVVGEESRLIIYPASPPRLTYWSRIGLYPGRNPYGYDVWSVTIDANTGEIISARRVGPDDTPYYVRPRTPVRPRSADSSVVPNSTEIVDPLQSPDVFPLSPPETLKIEEEKEPVPPIPPKQSARNMSSPPPSQR